VIADIVYQFLDCTVHRAASASDSPLGRIRAFGSTIRWACRVARSDFDIPRQQVSSQRTPRVISHSKGGT
jgi:hypothetical protein